MRGGALCELPLSGPKLDEGAPSCRKVEWHPGALASSLPTWRAPPTMPLLEKARHMRARGLKRARARSSGRGFPVDYSSRMRLVFSFMRSPTISAISCARSQRRSRSRSHGEVDSDQRSGRVRLRPLTLETTMQTVADRSEAPNAIRTDLGAIFVSLELSRSTWLITSLSPDGGEKMSNDLPPIWWTLD